MAVQGLLCAPCSNASQGRMRMKKSDLFASVAAEASLSRADAETAVNAVLGSIGDALANGETVNIVEFGSFSVKDRPARQGRNPRNEGARDPLLVSQAPSILDRPAMERA